MADSVIELVERGVGENGSHVVRVSFLGEGTEFDVTVTDPASDDDEELLAWYFEQHLRFPFLDGDRRRAAVEVLGGYGRRLFAQVFGGSAGFGYQLMRRRGFAGCRIEVVGSAGLHRLHWEAMSDPELDTPLALRIPITRRVESQSARFEMAGPWPTLNILVVTARPGGIGDVGYRTISRPLVDAVRQADLPVRIDFVRPGTWAGLRAHLETTRAAHGLGWYQLVHFDVHGIFADHASMKAGSRAGRYLLAADAESFEGKRGFLFFDTDRVGTADPRSAQQVAGLLAEHLVPMAVLNACQSAMQSGSEAALAQQLVQAGVPHVIGMAYSVTVTAAALAMPVLYQQLARGVAPELALRLMRRQLFDVPDRQGYFDQALPLADWVLPVAFRQHTVDLGVRAMHTAEEEAFLSREAAMGEEPAPEYGFVGRDLDIQGIERALLIDPNRNQVLVQGMAGAGKSTLLTHLGWWWQRTGLIEEAFTFSYKHRAWTVDQIIRQIAARLWPDKVEFAIWDSMAETAKRERVARALRTQRHLLIIDNTESITAEPAAIPHVLPDTEQRALRAWLARLRAGKTLVVWGSREPETWIAADSFGTNVYPLGGLDPQAASVLADKILERHQATAYRGDPEQRDALNTLLKLLGGYPLPLEVVLPTLATTPPNRVLEEIEAGGGVADLIRLITEADDETLQGRASTVLDHLRRQSATRDRDPAKMAMALADLDLASIVAANAERGHVDVTEVRRLGRQGRLGDLSDDQLTSVVTGYLKVALTEDLVADRELIGAYLYRDQDGFADALLRLLQEKPTARSISELAGVTRSVDMAYIFVDILCRAHNTNQRLFDSAELGQAVVTLIEQEYWTTALAPLVATIPGFARVAARPAFLTRGQGGQWVAQVNAVAGIESPWSKLRASLDAGVGVTPAGPAIEDLWQVDPELVRELLARTILRDPTIIETLLDRVLSMLLYHGDAEIPSALLKQLSDAVVSDPDRQARIDFILYRKQARPKQGFSEPGDTYRTRLIELVVTTPMTSLERAGVIIAITQRLCLHWSARNAQSTLDGLWKLSHLTQTDASAKSAVTRAIAVENQATDGQLSGLLQLSRWQRELSAAGNVSPDVAVQRIRSLGPKASVPDLAFAIAQASHAGISSKDLVSVLRSTSWRGPDVLGWFELASFVTAELVSREFARPYEPGAFLIAAWIDGEFGQPSEHNLRALADYAKAQAELSNRMMATLSSDDSRWGKLSETIKGPLGRNKAHKKYRGERDDITGQ